MESIGDWIYLVLLLIFVASGMFGSKSKKKRPTVVLGSPEYEPDKAERTSWEMPGDADASQSQKAKMPEPALIPKAEPSVGPLTSRTSVASGNAGEEHSALEGVDFKDAEELKKAVIYSEILNRKY